MPIEHVAKVAIAGSIGSLWYTVTNPSCVSDLATAAELSGRPVFRCAVDFQNNPTMPLSGTGPPLEANAAVPTDSLYFVVQAGSGANFSSSAVYYTPGTTREIDRTGTPELSKSRSGGLTKGKSFIRRDPSYKKKKKKNKNNDDAYSDIVEATEDTGWACCLCCLWGGGGVGIAETASAAGEIKEGIPLEAEEVAAVGVAGATGCGCCGYIFCEFCGACCDAD
eukprot:TRINITY_DN67025_c11_g1_i1.p1 TRINITY_DN67025_c11_g1~~TRINITY_DN67025_c11_g1_i1.p1  ORF type:complete len:223 (+),score=11.87 TRINITY_DN67025_c11_g1_i1:44-712(+)